MLPVVMDRSSFNGSAIRYVLPVLWMTSCLRIMERMGLNQRTRVFRPVREVAAPGRSLPSPTASCLICGLWAEHSLPQPSQTERGGSPQTRQIESVDATVVLNKRRPWLTFTQRDNCRLSRDDVTDVYETRWVLT